MSQLDDAISEVNSSSTPTDVSPLEQAIHEVHADAGEPSPVTTPSLWDKYRGFQESQLAGVTGGIANMAGGAGYLGDLALGRSPEQAKRDQQGIASALTYSPRTAEGKKQTAAMGEAASYLGEKQGVEAGDWVLDKTGSPVLAAATNTAFNVPQYVLGAKGGKEALGEAPKPAPVKPSLTDEVLARGQEKGLVVPPSTVNPSLVNKVAEGAVGKLSTAQAASIKNQPIIDNLAREEFGLSKEEDLTPETMARIRGEAAPAYEAVKAIPEIKLGPSYHKELSALTSTADKITAEVPGYKATGSEQIQTLVNALKQPASLSGDTAVELSKSLRAEASSYEASAKRTLDPSDKAMARTYRGAATALENAIGDHLTDIGKPEIAANWDTARRTIAKTYSVQDALDGAGHVDASKLGKQSIKGKPLSGNLDLIADFANSFPKATSLKWSKESVPGLSPLDMYGGAAVGLATGLHEGAVLPAAAGAAFPIARMAGRSTILSKPGQKVMTSKSDPSTPGSLMTPLGRLAIAGEAGNSTNE